MEALAVEVCPDPVSGAGDFECSESPADIHASVGIDHDCPTDAGTVCRQRFGHTDGFRVAGGALFGVEKRTKVEAKSHVIEG